MAEDNIEQYTVYVRRDPDTKVATSEHWFKDYPTVHRIGGPALIIRNANTGNVVRLEYWFMNRPHRHDGPAILEFDEVTQECILEEWIDGDDYHRMGGKPAITVINPENGVVVREEYYEKCVRHRDGLPAIINRDPQSGEILLEEYYFKGVYQENPSGPEPS